MSDHPSTFNASGTQSGGFDWGDHATVHLKDEGQGVLGGLKAIHRGTLAEMVRMVSRMPEGERERYVIEKAGDRTLGIAEIMALAGRRDFPG